MPPVALSDVQLDALSEIGNIGAGNAGTSLAKMTDRVITLTVPDTRVVSFDQLPLLNGANPERPVIAAYVAFDGDAAGCVLLLFSARQAATLFSLLGLEFDGSLLRVPELHRSAVAEVGNVITSAYLSAMSCLTHLRLMPTPPGVAIGMSAAILSTIGAHLGQFADSGIVVQVNIRGTDMDLGVQLLMIPQTDSLHTILAALGLDNGGQVTGG